MKTNRLEKADKKKQIGKYGTRMEQTDWQKKTETIRLEKHVDWKEVRKKTE